MYTHDIKKCRLKSRRSPCCMIFRSSFDSKHKVSQSEVLYIRTYTYAVCVVLIVDKDNFLTAKPSFKAYTAAAASNVLRRAIALVWQSYQS